MVAVTVQSGTATARTVLLPTSAASLKGESEGREESEAREWRVKRESGGESEGGSEGDCDGGSGGESGWRE